MASFLNANLPSDEEGDEEYIPSPKDIETEQELAEDSREKTRKDLTSKNSPETKARVEELWKQLQQGTLSKTKNKKTTSDQWTEPEFLAKRKNQTEGRKADQTRTKKTQEKDVVAQRVRKTNVSLQPTESSEDSKAPKPPPLTRKRLPSGVDALLESLSKKKKTSVLDRSKNDWRGFKKTHKKDAEELNAHQKSSEKYLEKTEFLERAAQKEYELNREKRRQRQ